MKKGFYVFWIVLFLVAIVMPLFCINTDVITEQENRTLATFPTILKEDRLNYDFGKEFDSWLGDRFWGRDELIDARFQIMYKINGRVENENVFVGDDGWMFEKWAVVNVPPLEEQRERINKNADILKRFDDKFKEKNIPIYFVLIPDRTQLYQKYWEKYYAPKPKLNYNEELIKALSDHPNIHVIYPKREFLNAMKQENVFRKKDSHLTSFGVHIINQSLLAVFKKEILPSLKWESKQILETTTQKTDLSAALGLSTQETVRLYQYFFVMHNSNSYQEKETFERIVEADGVYKGLKEVIFRRGMAVNSSFQKTFISIGICYSCSIFDLLKNEFAESIWIRTNVSVLGKEAYEHAVKKLKELFSLKENSAVLVLVVNEFEMDAIADSLKE